MWAPPLIVRKVALFATGLSHPSLILEMKRDIRAPQTCCFSLRAIALTDILGRHFICAASWQPGRRFWTGDNGRGAHKRTHADPDPVIHSRACILHVQGGKEVTHTHIHTDPRRASKGRPSHLVVHSVGHDGGRLLLLSIAEGSDPQSNLQPKQSKVWLKNGIKICLLVCYGRKWLI